MLVRSDERPRTRLAGGVVCEELAAPGSFIEPFIVEYPPGSDNGGEGVVKRPGHSFILGLEGTLRITPEGDEPEEVVVGPGRALTMAGGQPWSCLNCGVSNARLLWVDELASDAWRRAFSSAADSDGR